MFGTYEYSAAIGDNETTAWGVWRIEHWFLWWRWSEWRWHVQYYQPDQLRPYATFTGVRKTEHEAKTAVSCLIQGRS